MRTIGVVTTSRADYGIYRPILRVIASDPDLRLQLYVTGMHLAPEFGMTVRQIEADGLEVFAAIEGLLSSDSPGGVAKSMGLTTLGFAQALQQSRPDILLVLGDRFEMFAAVAATLPFRLPVAHIHGGESTEGLIDEPIRHAITKMSHLHFPTTEAYARRIVRMGEEPWRVLCCGAPSLDNLNGFQPLTAAQMTERFGLSLSEDFLLVTFHPVTLEFEQTGNHVDELLAALEESGLSLIFTYPNADTQGRLIIERIEAFRRRLPRVQIAANLGTDGYFSLMRQARAMAGNSSSGIIEAASFGLPVVNIGNRQRGRVHGRNVLDIPCSRGAILEAIRKAVSPEFHASLAAMENPWTTVCCSRPFSTGRPPHENPVRRHGSIQPPLFG
jgi:UDP-hydrolysing UDP-N-acetyl-D-glucosamine 2-epimerase